MTQVLIVMGSESDMPIMQKAADFFKEHDISYEIHVASAHRNPKKVHALAEQVEKSMDVVIAAAGMAAHLPGVFASLVTKPVIGVPINSSMDGLDALLAIVQMPPGIPVATVAINGAKNAAILAMQMLALKDTKIQARFQAFRQSMQA